MVTSLDEFNILGYRRALLVSSNKALSGIISAMLVHVGFEVQLISSAEAKALKPEDFTILIFDGDPSDRFTEFHPGVIVIAPSDAIKMYEMGADLVIERPLSAKVFIAKIRAMLRRYNIFI
ncbi:MAG: response regulator transcription factor [Bacteroidales bacterium]|nr:response regulator transcription factor [Bacteroidales bacterium]